MIIEFGANQPMHIGVLSLDLSQWERGYELGDVTVYSAAVSQAQLVCRIFDAHACERNVFIIEFERHATGLHVVKIVDVSREGLKTAVVAQVNCWRISEVASNIFALMQKHIKYERHCSLHERSFNDAKG